MKAAYEKTVAELGKLDIVVNCAGIVGPTGVKALDVDVSAFKKVLDVNLTGRSATMTTCSTDE